MGILYRGVELFMLRMYWYTHCINSYVGNPAEGNWFFYIGLWMNVSIFFLFLYFNVMIYIFIVVWILFMKYFLTWHMSDYFFFLYHHHSLLLNEMSFMFTLMPGKNIFKFHCYHFLSLFFFVFSSFIFHFTFVMKNAIGINESLFLF